MPLNVPFENSYAQLPERMYARLNPTPVRMPELLAFNRPLANELGISGTESATELAQIFAGNIIPEGADPISQAYAGHQFGNFVPSLGDGRAVLLGEVIDTNGQRKDIQLKGSGRTPFSRNGDGRAWLGPALREYVVSEAMHALGIPTSRALAAVTTGETIVRQEGAVPGAVITRVASSHIRIGTFQYFAARGDQEAVGELLNHAINRHYPQAESPLDFLRHVIDRQIELVSKWLGVGFIHGVMNTDNTLISGETIDYGPCAFLDRHHPETVFSSIDNFGRYAFDNQSNVLVWNIAQLASSLLILEADPDRVLNEYEEVVHAMPNRLEQERIKVFGKKLGISDIRQGDQTVIDQLLSIMTDQQADFTNTFRSLATGSAPFGLTAASDYKDWEKSWKRRLDAEHSPDETMLSANPALIPRNHRIEQMITAAVSGDLSVFMRLMDALSKPFADNPEFSDLALPPEIHEEVEATYCGT